MLTKRIFTGRALFVERDIIWVARGSSFWGINAEGRQITRKYKATNSWHQILSYYRLPRQLLRIGIHHLIPLKNGGFLVTVKGKTCILDGHGNIISEFRGYRGNKPANRGICTIPDGTIFFGEYTINLRNDHPTSLYRSTDNGLSFKEIHRFADKDVRHIHFVEWDKFEKCIWMGTGDKDYECKLMKSYNQGNTWETVGQGTQMWRAVGLAFTKDFLYWGTDAGSVADLNYIMRMPRKTCLPEKVHEVQGPCHSNAALQDGTVLVATGVEGGRNEWDRWAHVWKLDNSGTFKEVGKFKKDILPHIVQYGVIRFPMGMDQTNLNIFTTFALSGNGEKVYVET